MKKKLLCGLLAGVLCVGGLAGCADNLDSQSTGGQQQNSGAENQGAGNESADQGKDTESPQGGVPEQ